MNEKPNLDMLKLRAAIEDSWSSETAHPSTVSQLGNPALGNCYPTALVVQHFFPDTVIIEGKIWTGKALEKHYWNMLVSDVNEYHIDLTWQQFPLGSVVKEYKIRNRETLGTSEITIKRVDLLLRRVVKYLKL